MRFGFDCTDQSCFVDIIVCHCQVYYEVEFSDVCVMLNLLYG